MGVFFIDLNYKALKDLCERNNIGSDYIYIIDPTGKIIYHPKQKLIYSSLKTELVDEVLECEDSFFLTDDEKNRRLYTISVSDKTGWSVVGVTDMAELMRGALGSPETVHCHNRGLSCGDNPAVCDFFFGNHTSAGTAEGFHERSGKRKV